jgi:hypothetical protein
LLTGGLTPLVSDTASFTEEIASLLTGGFKPPTTQTLSFSDTLASTLHISNATLTSPTGTGNITVSPSAGTVLTRVSAEPVPPNNQPPVPSGAVSVNLPHGLIAFEANTTPGDFAVITIQYPSLPPLQSNQYFTYFKLVNGTWKEVKLNDTSNPNGYFTLSVTTVTLTLHIKDNGQFDANNALGVVSDPGGIAVVTTQQPPAAVGGGGGGGPAVIIQPTPTKTTVPTSLTLNVKDTQVGKDITIAGTITDDKGNKLSIDGILSVTFTGKTGLSKTYTAEVKNGEYALTVSAAEVLRAVKSREVSISVTFNGVEIQQANKIVEYKGADIKGDVKISADTVTEKVKAFKRSINVVLENFTDHNIAKITLHAEDKDGKGKIIVVQGKDFDRKRISMHEVELSIKKGKSISFADIVKFVIVKEGKVVYKVYDDTGRLIKEGSI